MMPKTRETRKLSNPSVRSRRGSALAQRSGGRTRTATGKRKSGDSNRKIPIIFLLLFVIFAGGWGILSAFSAPKGSGEQTVIIESGASASSISEQLKEEGIIRSPWAFRTYTRLFANGGEFKAGTYLVEKPITLKALTRLLQEGSNVAGGIKVTVPEGYVLTQIATLLSEKGLGDREGLLALAKDGEFDYEFLDFQKPSGMKYKLEGFIFPETYYFPEGASNETVWSVFLDEFEKTIWKELQQAAASKGLKPLEILTMASIVEKEAVLDQERGKIAGVFYNRLGIDMSLQSCATVQYALNREKFATVVTIEETRLENPYNTYRYPGLPPGPICNPGLAAIEAAMYPEASNYLFFVAKGDGGHQFSVTYEEHLAAIEKYQK